jgi:hypothetical protein
MSSAQKIAEMFHNDGQNWISNDDRFLGDVCIEDETFQSRYISNGAIKYLFTDGSTIVATREGWDFGVNANPNCFCWVGCGCHCERF